MIFLIGFMGSGKTSLGKRMADRLGQPFYDMDDILESSQRKSISRIFADHGEPFFRILESNLLKNLPEDGVCATGGGIVLNEENRAILKSSRHRTIFLNTGWNDLWSRIKNSNRPLVKGKSQEEVRRLWEERLPLYQKCANLTVKAPTTG